MKSLVRPSFWRAHAGLDDRARQAARRAYAQFARDPGQPSLRFKKLGGYDHIWSVRVNEQYRAVGEIGSARRRKRIAQRFIAGSGRTRACESRRDDRNHALPAPKPNGGSFVPAGLPPGTQRLRPFRGGPRKPDSIPPKSARNPHPDNGGKAAFFHALGFSREQWRCASWRPRPMSPEGLESPHGRKYVLNGQLESPSGRTPVIRTIWIVDAGQDAPRLVTAYPREE